jgi:sulfotransferase family protein
MITIVSGLPRSGTSLMMQMLDAGGLPVLSDGERKADTDNPKGYLEWERIKQLPKDPSLIAEAEGKVVKVISQLILSLPSGFDYRVILMQRPLPEVLKSQDEMLRRRGNADSNADASAIEEAFQRHLIEVNKWLAGKANVQVSRVHYHRVLREPKAVAGEIAAFLGRSLDIEAMVRQVDGSLYRNRMKQGREHRR